MISLIRCTSPLKDTSLVPHHFSVTLCCSLIIGFRDIQLLICNTKWFHIDYKSSSAVLSFDQDHRKIRNDILYNLVEHFTAIHSLVLGFIPILIHSHLLSPFLFLFQRRMAGPTQDDLERQFQADLERAAALSMETLALDEFKRKQRNSGGRSEQPQLDFSTARLTISEQQQQRRRSNETTTSTSRNTAAPDLISFSGPDPNPVDLASPQSNGGAAAAAAAPAPDKHTSFVQYVDQIHQITAQQQQYLARMPQSTAITPFGRPPLGIPIAGPAGMQLMPYQAPPPSQPVAQTQPLTPDNLQKLYNSPYYGHSAGVSPFPRFPGHQYVASAVAANQAQVAAPYPGHLPQSVMNQQVHNTPLSTGNY